MAGARCATGAIDDGLFAFGGLLTGADFFAMVGDAAGALGNGFFGTAKEF